VLQDKWASGHMMHPPYTPKVRKLIKTITGFVSR